MDYLRGTMAIDSSGHLTIGGCSAVELVSTYGTPLYVLDEELIRARCRAYIDGFSQSSIDAEVIYAGKALLTTAICRIIEDEGLSLDVVSGGELYTALQADFPTNRIYFHGNNKSRAELRMALEADVHTIVVDNLFELENLERLAGDLGKTVSVMLRVTPGIEAHTHSYIQTGQEDSKFGFPLVEGIALHAAGKALSCQHLQLIGFHCHIGSQIFDLSSYEAAAAAMFDLMHRVRTEFGFVVPKLNLGGGLGIRYADGDVSVDPRQYAVTLSEIVRSEASARNYPLPTLLVEPGRSIVGEAGTTLYTIGGIKKIPGVRTYVSVDGGMADNPRVALYQAKYEAVIANRANQKATQRVSIAGKFCESGDMLIWDLDVPSIEPGDILAVLSTGAYNYSMASNYNRIPRPAMVLVADGRSDVIVEREQYSDVVRLDRIPDRLRRAHDEAAAAEETSNGNSVR